MAEQPIIIKKKIIQAAAHHGGSWKVAYADFVTAMMAFFLVMWIMNMSDETKNQIQGYFNDPLGFSNSSPKSRTIVTLPGEPRPKPGSQKNEGTVAVEDEQKELGEVARKIKQALTDPKFADLIKGVKISVTNEGLLLELMETQGAVFFESGSSIIRPEARQLIDRLAPILKTAHHPMEIQGHTDAQPFAGGTGNWGLSAERAGSLQASLFQDGLNDFTQITGFGATRLLDPGHPFASCNRRVTILLPRKYTIGGSTEEPADSLRASIRGRNLPQAVVVGPALPIIKGQAKG